MQIELKKTVMNCCGQFVPWNPNCWLRCGFSRSSIDLINCIWKFVRSVKKIPIVLTGLYKYRWSLLVHPEGEKYGEMKGNNSPNLTLSEVSSTGVAFKPALQKERYTKCWETYFPFFSIELVQRTTLFLVELFWVFCIRYQKCYEKSMYYKFLDTNRMFGNIFLVYPVVLFKDVF